MGKPKAQGTAWETAIVKMATAAGLKARRLPEGGASDEGDVELLDSAGQRHIIEAKNAQTITAHAVLEKALAKAGGERAAVAWRRPLKLAEGQLRRRQAGRPIVVLSLAEYLTLLANQAAPTPTLELEDDDDHDR